MKLSNTLIYWYLQKNRDLPWRKTNDPYLVWLSEIMLQQTRVAQGMSYYLKFSEEFPTVNHLANADESTVLKMWQGLGYYSRARNLHFTAKYIAKELKGVFPSTYKELIKLKGVGDYTASAIASICFNEATAVVDGNVYRVLARYFGNHLPINSTKGIKEFKTLAQSLIDKNQPGVYNQAIMDFGSLQCKPQNPDCSICPLSSSCVAFEKKRIKELPVKEKKIKIKNRFFNYLVFVTEKGDTIIEERKGKGIWQGLYQFPLIETKKELDTIVGLEEFETKVFSDCMIKLFNENPIVHKLSHQHLYTKFWIVGVKTHPNTNTSWRKINEYPVPVLISNFLDKFNYKLHQNF
ncbi:A/G-specific adenine glycosylase [Pseudotenacibaculum sp. MALMAid0570]|uniref:A/G-specific adenine glycosylase n=1 Tax=Pseudotenacibaculum sp. MALMAid0570 TaxID=3143938 RepID=UPI0032E0494B